MKILKKKIIRTQNKILNGFLTQTKQQPQQPHKNNHNLLVTTILLLLILYMNYYFEYNKGGII